MNSLLFPPVVFFFPVTHPTIKGVKTSAVLNPVEFVYILSLNWLTISLVCSKREITESRVDSPSPVLALICSWYFCVVSERANVLYYLVCINIKMLVKSGVKAG